MGQVEGKYKSAHKILIGKPEEELCGWEDNIKKNVTLFHHSVQFWVHSGLPAAKFDSYPKGRGAPTASIEQPEREADLT